MQTELTLSQKLQALSLKHYDGFAWNPKKGDYYTSSRNDLELYQIVDENETSFFTKYCHPDRGESTAEWSKERFLKDFGERRVYVPDFIFKMQS